MSEFNSCANLVENTAVVDEAKELYHNLMNSGKNPLDFMMGLQKSLQIRLHEDKPVGNPHPDKLKTCGQIADWTRNQDLYIADENMELLTSLGGMSNGSDASAIWKPWKSKHVEARNVEFDSLPDSDKLETLFELIDAWHFFMNKHMPFNLSAEDIFVLYYIKNKENISRQNRGY